WTLKLSSATPKPACSLKIPASRKSTASVSGQTRSPQKSTSSAVLVTTLSAPGASSACSPTASLAAPVPPASSATRGRVNTLPPPLRPSPLAGEVARQGRRGGPRHPHRQPGAATPGPVKTLPPPCGEGRGGGGRRKHRRRSTEQVELGGSEQLAAGARGGLGTPAAHDRGGHSRSLAHH